MKNTIDTLVEALENAKERLGFYQRHYGYGDEISDREGNEIIDSALAKARLEQSEPADWRCTSCATHEVSLELTCHNSKCNQYAKATTIHEGWKYTAPAAPATLQPLTRDEIMHMAREAGLRRTNPGEAIEIVNLVRAIEADYKAKLRGAS